MSEPETTRAQDATEPSRATKEYPKTLYIKWDGEDDDAFLNAFEDPNDLAVIGEEILVRVYELKKVALLKSTVEIS